MATPVITSHPSERNVRDFFEQHLVLIGVTVLTVMTLVGWFFLIRPAMGAYQRVSETSLSDLEVRLTERRRSLEKARFIEEQSSQITPGDYEKINAVLPTEPGAADLIPNIEAIVLLSGLTLESVSVTQSSDPQRSAPSEMIAAGLSGSIHSVPITLRANGNNYSTFKELLHRIETNLRLLDVPSISFNPKDDVIQMSVTAYYQRAPGAQN
ncbi:MAG: hypothetical protein AB1352_00795 [Patescibacteria group bacterium]